MRRQFLWLSIPLLLFIGCASGEQAGRPQPPASDLDVSQASDLVDTPIDDALDRPEVPIDADPDAVDVETSDTADAADGDAPDIVSDSAQDADLADSIKLLFNDLSAYAPEQINAKSTSEFSKSMFTSS